MDALQAATFVGRAFTLAHFRPEAHHDANTIVPLFDQERRRHRTIDAPAHCHDDSGVGGTFCLLLHGDLLRQFLEQQP
jgi:hypothetical protein